MLGYSGLMRVRVLYFGVLRDLAGHREVEVELAEGLSVAEFLAFQRASFQRASVAEASQLWDSIAVAVNKEYARGDVVLRDGDEVALLPPVSGGRGL